LGILKNLKSKGFSQYLNIMTESEGFVKGFEKDAKTITAFFQKNRAIVIAFVISMPVNCVILEVEVIFPFFFLLS